MAAAARASTPFRLGLLVCGHVHPAALHIGGDYPELFHTLLSPLGIELAVYRAEQGQLPASVDECQGWITSPARASVNDDEQWIRDVEDLIRRLVAEQRPFVGLCFGHQLLARSLGGRVERAAAGWGVGAQRYDIVQSQWWMEPAASSVVLVASHEDQVVELPREARLLARSDHCPNAMMAMGDRAIGIQAHPEFSVALSRTLTGLRTELIGAEAAARAQASLSTPLDRQTVAAWIGRFLTGS